MHVRKITKAVGDALNLKLKLRTLRECQIAFEGAYRREMSCGGEVVHEFFLEVMEIIPIDFLLKMTGLSVDELPDITTNAINVTGCDAGKLFCDLPEPPSKPWIADSRTRWPSLEVFRTIEYEYCTLPNSLLKLLMLWDCRNFKPYDKRDSARALFTAWAEDGACPYSKGAGKRFNIGPSQRIWRDSCTTARFPTDGEVRQALINFFSRSV